MFKKNTLQLSIYLSALLLCAGLFLPLTGFPVVGEVSYYRIAHTESWCIIALALAAPALILAGREKWSIVCAAGVWIVLLYPAIRSALRPGNDTVLNRLGTEVTSAMVDFAGDLFMNIAEFHWGGFVLLLALLAFTLSSVAFRFKA